VAAYRARRRGDCAHFIRKRGLSVTKKLNVFQTFRVYLAGPVTGLHYDGAQDWRDKAQDALALAGVKAFSPLRSKQYLRAVGELQATAEGYGDLSAMSTPRGIMTRDRFDATRADALLVNLLGATRVSIGTCMEIAWADLARIPVVVAIEPAGNVHEHDMINEATGYRVGSIDAGIEIIKAMADNGIDL
jgi:nucleoside 2-deoxyribosyltransferase